MSTAPAPADRAARTLVASVPASVVTLTGPDALSFLQSLASQDVGDLAVGSSAPSLLLQPQGKLVAAFRVQRVAEQEVWLVADDGVGETLRAGLARFKIRVAVEIADRSTELVRLCLRGPQAEAIAAAADLGDDTVVVAAPWPSVAGVDLIVPRDRQAVALDALVRAGAEAADATAIESWRIEQGVPKAGAELDETVIPQEAFLEREAVSFTKGCFLGQELVCRIDSRGHVNRLLRGLVLGPDESVPAVGAPVVAGDKVVGAVTSAARSDALGAIGLAYVRREVEPGARVEVGGVAAQVRELPLR